MNDAARDDGAISESLEVIPARVQDAAVEVAPELGGERIGELLPIESALERNAGTSVESRSYNESASGFHDVTGALQPESYLLAVPERPVARTPNFADALLFLVLLLLGVVVSTGGVGLALHFHWFGLRSIEQAAKSTPVTLVIELLIYGIALAGAVPFFHMVWGKGYFAGLHWHGATAFRLRYRLIWTAVGCNVLAMAGNWFLPFPDHAPIDKLFGTSSDAWMLACFGVLIAPFFEEMIFRGFLLPAVATGWDWLGERMTGAKARPLDASGNPIWSLGAMIFASLMVSAPFALMHATQLGNAWGPLVLLYCVSLILCTVRLATRSLAASTLVHSAYNFMLFAVMFAQTDGFRHMDKM